MCYIDYTSSKGTDIIKEVSKNDKKGQKNSKNSLSANAATCRDNSYNRKFFKASE